MYKEEYANDMIMRYELEQCTIPPKTAEHMRQAVTFENECNCVQRRFYRSLKYKKISENKYKRCMSAFVEALLILLILAAFLVLGTAL